MWVSPFRNLRIIGYLLLPVAYRSLSRLSSALSAKASTLRSSSLNQISNRAGCSIQFNMYSVTCSDWLCLRLSKPRCLSWHYQYLLILDIFGIRFSRYKLLSIYNNVFRRLLSKNWQPPALPHRLQCSTIGRLSLNHRVRDGNGCLP